MSSIPCPFCGELMNSPLKFCVSCGRGITQEDLSRAGLKIQKGAGESGPASGKFALSRKEYSFHRQMRATFLTLSAVLTLVIGYYCTMRYVLHEHLPFNLDLMLETLVAGGTLEEATAAAQNAGTSSGITRQPTVEQGTSTP